MFQPANHAPCSLARQIVHDTAEDPHRPFLLLDLALYGYQWQLPVLAKLAESRIHRALSLGNAVPFFLRLTKAGSCCLVW